MNLVAHQLLSFQDEDLMIGNLLGEVVRGKGHRKYPEKVAKGILLHRAIDTFTDEHKQVKNSTKLLHKTQGKYAPVVIDIVYDYFLIKNWKRFSNVDFTSFKNNCYQIFQKRKSELPTSLNEMVSYLIKEDWFTNYSTLDGVTQTLTGMGMRRKYQNNLRYAIREVYLHEKKIEEDFLIYFPQLFQHCNKFVFGN